MYFIAHPSFGRRKTFATNDREHLNELVSSLVIFRMNFKLKLIFQVPESAQLISVQGFSFIVLFFLWQYKRVGVQTFVHIPSFVMNGYNILE